MRCPVGTRASREGKFLEFGVSLLGFNLRRREI
jgi:hypothetical protein